MYEITIIIAAIIVAFFFSQLQSGKAGFFLLHGDAHKEPDWTDTKPDPNPQPFPNHDHSFLFQLLSYMNHSSAIKGKDLLDPCDFSG